MPTIDIPATGDNIKAMCLDNHITVKNIQAACGFTTGNAVYKWLKGICLPTIDNMVILATLFHTTIDQIIVIKTI